MTLTSVSQPGDRPSAAALVSLTTEGRSVIIAVVIGETNHGHR